MPNIIDKRKTNWIVTINNEDCPFITYPRSDIACNLLENSIKADTQDTYCYEQNCPLKLKLK